MRNVLLIGMVLIAHLLNAQVEVVVDYKPKPDRMNGAPENGYVCTNRSQYDAYTRKNIPACLNENGIYLYNWFAYRVGKFSDVESGRYQLVTSDDREPLRDWLKDKPTEKVWIGNSLKNEYGKIYNNKFNAIDTVMSSSCVILKVPTPEYFFQKELDYLDPKFTKKTKPQLSSLRMNLAEHLDQEDFKNKMLNCSSFSATLTGSIAFTSLKPVLDVRVGVIRQVDAINAENILSELKGEIDSVATSWAHRSYLFTNYKNKKYRLPTKPIQFEVKLVNTSNAPRYKIGMMKLSTIESIFDTATLNKEVLYMPKSARIWYKETAINITVLTPDTSLFETLPVKQKLLSVDLPKLNVLSPCLSVFGAGYHHVSWTYNKNDRAVSGKILPVLGCTSLGVAAVSYVMKNNFYGRYLNDPYTQTNAYNAANFAQKSAVISSLLWLCVVPIDITLTIRQMKRTKAWVDEINYYRLND